MESFSFTHDLKKVNWGDTLTYNFMRGASAGLILGLIVAMNAPDQSHVEYSFLQAPVTILSFMIGMPLMLIVLFIPYNLILSLLSNFQGGAGLFVLRIVAIVLAMLPAIGDPLIKILLKYFPKLVDIENPGWFQTKVIVFVLK